MIPYKKKYCDEMLNNYSHITKYLGTYKNNTKSNIHNSWVSTHSGINRWCKVSLLGYFSVGVSVMKVLPITGNIKLHLITQTSITPNVHQHRP